MTCLSSNMVRGSALLLVYACFYISCNYFFNARISRFTIWEFYISLTIGIQCYSVRFITLDLLLISCLGEQNVACEKNSKVLLCYHIMIKIVR